jgi:hypothetical protein
MVVCEAAIDTGAVNPDENSGCQPPTGAAYSPLIPACLTTGAHFLSSARM